MRILAIDIGTNSTLYLAAEVRGNEVQVVERGITGNRLGQDLDEHNQMPPALLSYNRSILLDLKTKAKALRCVKIAAVGTQALRRAGNSREFLDMAGEIGAPLRIITPAEEAHLAWRGVFGNAGPQVPTALLDIGGGSSELSIGWCELPAWSSSIPCGAVGLAKDYFLMDPPSSPQVEAASKEIRRAFIGWRSKLTDRIKVIGIAGTVTALASLAKRTKEFQPGCWEGFILKKEAIQTYAEMLLKMDYKARELLPGMPPVRAGSIHAGALILNELAEILSFDEIQTSERGVLFGLAWEMAEV